MDEVSGVNVIKVEPYLHQGEMSPPKMSTNMKGTFAISFQLRKSVVGSTEACAKSVSAILCFVDALQTMNKMLSSK